jgi:perosamine synthetase
VIPLFKPSCTDEEVAAVERVLRSGWWAQGAETELFEAEFASYVRGKGAPGSPLLHAAAVNSGTAALELAGRALTQELFFPPKVAIVPAFTFVSTALALKHAGYEIRFADVDPVTRCIDWRSAREQLDFVQPEYWDRTVVAPVWYGGTVTSPPDDFPWQVKILEDCAHAAGSAGAGHAGNASAWSFHAVKNLACGDGGMVVSPDAELIEHVKRLRWVGINKSTYDRDTKRGYSWDYDITEDGEKAHMNDITAALGRVQLRRLDDMNAARLFIAGWYTEALRDLDWLTLRGMPFPGSSNHLYTVRVPEASRDKFIDHLRAKGVSAGVHYKPLFYYENLFGKHQRWFHYPRTLDLFRSIVTLPLFPDMTNGEVQQVIAAVRSFSP